MKNPSLLFSLLCLSQILQSNGRIHQREDPRSTGTSSSRRPSTPRPHESPQGQQDQQGQDQQGQDQQGQQGQGEKPRVTHESLYPSSEDAYDAFVFDVHSMNGSPYGGFSRNVQSRLAKLPLRLVGGGLFELASASASVEGETAETAEMEKEQEEEMGEMEDQNQNLEEPLLLSRGNFQTPYFTMRDGDGRALACRIYNDEELTSESLQASVFDEAMESERTSMTTSMSTSTAGSAATGIVDDEEHLTQAATDDHTESSIQVQKQVLTAHPKTTTTTPPIPPATATATASTATMTSTTTSPNIHELPLALSVQQSQQINTALSRLEGICAQLHLGWWSYEWCHEDSVTQFHIQFAPSTSTSKKEKEEEQDDKKKKEGNGDDNDGKNDNGNDSDNDDKKKAKQVNYKVQNISSLGKWKKRRILFDEDTETATEAADEAEEKDQYAAPRPPSTSTAKSLKLNARKKEKMDMNMNMDMDNSKASKQETPRDSVPYTIRDVFSDGAYCDEANIHRSIDVELQCCQKEDVQKHFGAKWEEHSGRLLLSGLVNPTGQPHAALLRIEERDTCRYTATVCTNLLCFDDDKDADFGINTSEPPQYQQHQHQEQERQLSKTTPSFQRNDSIRHILNQSLEGTCIGKNEGWWSYMYCHKKRVLQYHINMDTHKKEVEIVLGNYHDKLDAFSDQDELNHLFGKEGLDGVERQLMLGGSSSSDNSDSTPYYVQEYVGGDVCEGEDVTDLSIKGGTIVNGGIDRAVSIRFLCGDKVDLFRVLEDSTCHYVFHITVPALCIQEHFEIPRVRTQAVKCLPI